ncbi:hypothetical protein [Erythrobacter sp. THAF29]|uniref:hypothetical protein n=1 Tax=Erythrobacter sp. THAF29 TaxID=2587851 RepID=UPI0012A89EA3|nr:hypothetical protein [Erythrobacter sp. THAF29]QFT78785.1 hypothetical protein FIU90_14640 [Erythrobacter sp. THAF29]
MKQLSIKPIRIGAIAARAAETNPSMPYVLGISLALASSMMSLAWILPALYL